MSSNKTQGTYKAKKAGKYFRSMNKLKLYMQIHIYGNPFYYGTVKTIR